MIPFSDFKFNYFQRVKWAGTFGGERTGFQGIVMKYINKTGVSGTGRFRQKCEKY